MPSNDETPASCPGAMKRFTHIGLEHYLIGACKKKKIWLIAQDKRAREGNWVTCGCGWNLYLHDAYRCLYCGEWYCGPCAENHFGKSRQTWTAEKRIEKRIEMEAKMKQGKETK